MDALREGGGNRWEKFLPSGLGRGERERRAERLEPVFSLVEEMGAQAGFVVGGTVEVVPEKGLGGWRWDWRGGRVWICWRDLVGKWGGLSRAVLLHECGHQAITRCLRLWGEDKLKVYFPLLHLLEDLRVERWLARGWPGMEEWIADANRQRILAEAEAPRKRSRQAQFLRAIDGGLGGAGAAGRECCCEVLVALEGVRGAVDAYAATMPASWSCCGIPEKEVLTKQKEALKILEGGILPVWEGLLAADRKSGFPEFWRYAEGVYPPDNPAMPPWGVTALLPSGRRMRRLLEARENSFGCLEGGHQAPEADAKKELRWERRDRRQMAEVLRSAGEWARAVRGTADVVCGGIRVAVLCDSSGEEREKALDAATFWLGVCGEIGIPSVAWGGRREDRSAWLAPARRRGAGEIAEFRKRVFFSEGSEKKDEERRNPLVGGVRRIRGSGIFDGGGQGLILCAGPEAAFFENFSFASGWGSECALAFREELGAFAVSKNLLLARLFFAGQSRAGTEFDLERLGKKEVCSDAGRLFWAALSRIASA